MIDKSEVKDIAKLAEIELGREELEKVIPLLNNILDHIDTVNSADTENIKPTSHVIDINNVFREDKPRRSLSREEALKNAPDVENSGFKVPKID